MNMFNKKKKKEISQEAINEFKKTMETEAKTVEEAQAEMDELPVDEKTRGTIKFIKKEKKFVIIIKDKSVYKREFDNNDLRDEFIERIYNGVKKKCKKLRIKIAKG